ncbi:MAG: argininosuccinate lyase [Acidobacteria bacterium]|nr:MAG: argininosuccinate lyase [Acidobacteriota bacterium]
MAWSGRFASGPVDGLMSFSRSVAVDGRLWSVDIEGSRAHVGALEKAGVVSPDEASSLRDALTQVAEEFTTSQFDFLDADEDIHMAIERRLTEIVGDLGRKIHAGRSRNDQVALDLRLYLLREARELAVAVLGLGETLVDRAAETGSSLLPGYTHLQRAQPVLVAHHLLAHVWPLIRDVGRLRDATSRAEISPLGAGALAGTSIPIDPEFAAAELGMSGQFDNSMDAVADRDFVAEYLFAMALIQVHLSRLAEEIVIWATDEFNFVSLSDEWSTGSSMMPQKKNPDVAELVRGRTGRVVGNLVNLLVVLKGLPLAYNRDLQEDKEPVFDSISVVKESAIALTGLMATLEFNFAPMEQAAAAGYSAATDLAEELVMAGVPFREAHRLVGELVFKLEQEQRGLEAVTRDELSELHPALSSIDENRLRPSSVAAARVTPGGTAPAAVENQMSKAQGAIADMYRWAQGPPASDAQ